MRDDLDKPYIDTEVPACFQNGAHSLHICRDVAGRRIFTQEARSVDSGAVASSDDSNAMPREERALGARQDLNRLRRIADESFDVDDLGGSLRDLCDYTVRLEREIATKREAFRMIAQCRWNNGNGTICRACSELAQHHQRDHTALVAERSDGGPE